MGGETTASSNNEKHMAEVAKVADKQEVQTQAGEAADKKERVEQAAAHGSSFIPSSAFAGARPGYCFKTGPEGLGYYEDPVQAGLHGSNERKAFAKSVSQPATGDLKASTESKTSAEPKAHGDDPRAQLVDGPE